MDTTTFTTLVTWVIAHGYFLFFIAAFLEGPLVTAAAGVAAALGYYSIAIIIILSVMGDLTGDIVYYSIGYVTRHSLLDRYGHWFGLSPNHIDRMQRFIHRHLIKSLIVVKLSGVIAVPSLIIIGSSRAPLKKFTIACLLITLPKSLLFGLLGFFSGRAYGYLSQTVTNSQYVMAGIALAFVVIYVGYQKVSAYLSRMIAGDQDIVA